jgi:rhodanese-related sulfurtransferase
MEPSKLTPAQVMAKLDAGELVAFLDDRSPSAWSTSHTKIPGALRVPPGEEEQHLAQLAAVPKSATVVTYCTCPDEHSSARVARTLNDRGWREARPLKGGFDAWRKAGYPVEPR